MNSKEYRFDTNSRLHVKNGDFAQILLEGNEIEVEIMCEERAEATVYVQMKDVSVVKLNTNILSGATCKILLWNNSDKQLKVTEEYHVKSDGNLLVSYGELSSGNMERNSIIHLDEKGATAHVFSATVCGNVKKSYIEIAHHAQNSSGEMEHYGIILKGGQFKIEAVGKIDKGASSSKSHQSTRILTFDKKQDAIVLPMLLIDENDVEASHATSLGQPDENQLYYMQSRGLSRQNAMELITLGYLLPIASKLQNDELREILERQIEQKVKELWSM